MVRLLLTATLIACASAAGAQSSARLTPAERGLVAAEEQRFHALVAGDTATVARGLADDLTFSHMTGMRRTKAEFLADLASGRAPYRSISAHDRDVHVIGAVGVIRGVRDQQVGDRQLSDGYLSVYVRRAGRWQLLEWQSAAPPPAPGQPPAPPPTH